MTYYRKKIKIWINFGISCNIITNHRSMTTMKLWIKYEHYKQHKPQNNKRKAKKE